MTTQATDKSPALRTYGNNVNHLSLALLLGVAAPLAGAPGSAPRPQLQIINGSAEAVNVFWLKTDTERIANGTVPAIAPRQPAQPAPQREASLATR